MNATFTNSDVATPATQTACEIADAVRSGRQSAVEVVRKALRRIDAGNAQLNAFVHLDADLALRQAERIDAIVARGEDPGPLAGVPIGVKDLEDCAGMPTSQGSLVLKGSPPAASDSAQVARARGAGAVFLGKTAASEFGIDSATHTVAWGTTRNPWNPALTPGGSSGGSAAAVAAGLVPMATGSDGGGSIRSPAGFCGLVGLKVSQGRIPRVPFSDVSVPGVLATTVADSARFLDVVAGPHSRVRVSFPREAIAYERVIETLPVGGLRARWSADMGYAAVDPVVLQVARTAAEALVAAADLHLDDGAFAPPNPYETFLALVLPELHGTLAASGAWPEHADDLCPLTRHAVELGASYSAADLARARDARAEIEAQTAALFEEVDVLMTPTTACLPFAAEGPIPETIAGQDARRSGAEPFMMLANLCWIPAVSIPAGLADGLPVGLQLVASRGREDVLLRLARILEDVKPWPRLAHTLEQRS